MSAFPDNYLLTIVELFAGIGGALVAIYLFPGERRLWGYEVKQRFFMLCGFIVGVSAVELVWRIGMALFR